MNNQRWHKKKVTRRQRRHEDESNESSCDFPLKAMTTVTDQPPQQQDGSTSIPPRPRALPIHQTNVPRVCCAILASMTTGGTTYAFGLYGIALKKKLHLSQSQLDTISAVFFAAGLLSFIPGACVDRFGSRFGMSIGGMTGSVSLMLFWLVVKEYFPSVIDNNDNTKVVVILSILNVIIFLSCALVTGSVFKIISCQCGPGSKGSAVGVAKGFVGLGSGAYACLFESMRQPFMSELDFLPLCAFFFVFAATIPSLIGLPTKANETFVPDVLTPLHFQVMYLSLSILAILIIGNALLRLYYDSIRGRLDDIDNNQNSIVNYAMAGLLLFVWIAPIISLLYLPQRSDWEPEVSTGSTGVTDQSQVEQVTLLSSNDATECNENPNDGISLESITPNREDSSIPGDEESSLQDVDETVDSQVTSSYSAVEDKNLFQMLQTPSAWMMLWITTILVGGGTVETNNLGQMVESLGFSPVVTPATLALFSVAQSGGRIITGSVSEASLTYETRQCLIDKGIPRPFFFVAASLLAMFAHTILAIATRQAFFVIGVTLSGVAFGMIWPLMVLCVGEIFGTANVGANYMFYDGFTSAAGTFLLSKIVAQRVYEEHIDPHSSGKGDGVTCYGEECFRQTHIIIVLLSTTCVGISILMQYKTRNVYSKSNAS